MKSITSVAELEAFLAHQGLTWQSAQLPAQTWLNEVGFPLRIPYHYAGLINWTDREDPLRKQVIPDEAEDHITRYELSDPIGDHDREAVPGLIHRYPDRCLLLLTSHCLVHCRFCFRKEIVGKVRPVELQKIAEYLSNHHEIKEVIFSGGDPGTYPAGFLQAIAKLLSGATHLERWRFHTRVPAVDPEAITPEWIAAVESLPGKKIIAIHINHPRELSAATKTLISTLLNKQVLLLSQTVLLKGVNDDPQVLRELFTSLTTAGVKPYYLHHLDKAKGTSHFRLSIEEGKAIYLQLRGNLSTVCLPEYVLDLPGGLDKIPVMWLEEVAPSRYKTTTFEGKVVVYQDPARETTSSPSS